MNTLRLKLENAFEDFERLQKELENIIRSNPDSFIKSIDQWLERYSRQGAVLQFLLESYRERLTPESDIQEAELWRDRLRSAIDNQGNLQRGIESLRSVIQQRLTEVKQGQKAIAGYHSGEGTGKPVFISRDA